MARSRIIGSTDKNGTATLDPGKMGGQPCIRGMRITVRRILEILATYPDRLELFKDTQIFKKKIFNKRLRLQRPLSTAPSIFTLMLREAQRSQRAGTGMRPQSRHPRDANAPVTLEMIGSSADSGCSSTRTRKGWLPSWTRFELCRSMAWLVSTTILNGTNALPRPCPQRVAGHLPHAPGNHRIFKFGGVRQIIGVIHRQRAVRTD
jgi:uncharacterized protein (DUF433 family)